MTGGPGACACVSSPEGVYWLIRYQLRSGQNWEEALHQAIATIDGLTEKDLEAASINFIKNPSVGDSAPEGWQPCCSPGKRRHVGFADFGGFFVARW